ncbi:5-bromo-4-chloroindolyl phosphate hydrolysis family protein [Ostreiculturibacter nitratireducens]|uniref:5-bromo-4-chloroindolyl phosphate hydrolysis family protein n=1 Tax=Ostreiculturibacter nitratireducens TaxID=3075226 RepID=UPI0031B63F9B
MAERFGGPYSPDNSRREKPGTPSRKHPFEGRRPTRAGGRVNMLFFAPFPLVLTAFGENAAGLAVDLAAFGTLILAAWLTREGELAHEAYEARKVARRPAIPRKIFASVLTGVGLFLGGFAPGVSVLNPVIFGLLGAVLHFLAFGPDPLKDKGMEGVDRFQQHRVGRAVEEGEKYLASMREAIQRVGDRHLIRRVEQFQTTARDLFRTVEEDPRDLTAARRYLGVYLMGARDATVKFADIWTRTKDQKARADYETLLTDLETNFAARTRTLLLDDRSDLDVEIEVLRDRLAREGLSINGKGEAQ